MSVRPLLAALLLALLAPACTKEPLTVYSGRNEALIGVLFERFEAETGIPVRVRYGETPQLAATLLEEGERSPADVYVAQDAGALGALSKAGLLAELPPELLARMADRRFKSPDGQWIGLSGRARVLAYNTAQVKKDELPSSIRDLTTPRWEGRVGWAPTNSSFQAFVTALRQLEGDEAAAAWLRAMKANGPRTYKNNMAIVEALARGEVDVGLVNHYYVFSAQKGRGEALPVANHYLGKGDPGTLINVSGAAILKGSKDSERARRLIAFLLAEPAQGHFAKETFEYPLVAGVPLDRRLQPLADVGSPDLDLSRLEDLQATVRLLQETGVL